METERKAISDPFEIQYVYGDEGYMEIMGRGLLAEGCGEEKRDRGPTSRPFGNLGVSDAPGSTVELDGETFTLTGIGIRDAGETG